DRSPVEVADLHRDSAPPRLDLDRVARQDALADGRGSHAERSGLPKQDRFHGLGLPGRAEHSDRGRRPTLLHDDRREPCVLRARLEEPVEHVLVQLRAEIVDVGLEEDLVRLGWGRGVLAGRRGLAHQDAEDVRELEPMGPGAVADGLNAHRRDLTESVGRRRQDRRARRGHELHRNPLRVQGRPAQQLQHGRCGDGERAVLRTRHPETRGDLGREDPLDPELRERERRAGDVHDRIDGPDLVKGHEIDLLAVHSGLRLRQSQEDALRESESLRRKAGGIEQRADACVGADHAGGGDPYRDAHRTNPLVVDFPDLELERLERKPLEVAAKLLGVRAGVEQRTERHVAGDAGEAVEVRDPHADAPARMMRWATSAAPNPLSMFTTQTPGAQLFSMVSRAASPRNADPTPTLVGTATTGREVSPATTEASAPSMPATAMTQSARSISALRSRSRWMPATPTS